MNSGLQLQNGYVNIFKAGTFPQIPYKVFVSTVTTNKALLLQAEWSIRKKHPHAVMKTVNTELWIFSLSGKEDLPLPDPQYGLKEISTGVFLSSTLAAGDGFLPAPYNPFIQAIKQLASTCTINTLKKTLPLGQNFYLPDTETLLHCDVGFSTTGDLTFKLYEEPTALTIASREVINKLSHSSTSGSSTTATSIRVQICPTGLSGVFVGFADHPPAESSQFLGSLSVVTNCDEIGDTDAALEWIDIKLDSNGKTVSWPLRYCLCDLPKAFFATRLEFPQSVSSSNVWSQIKKRISSMRKMEELSTSSTTSLSSYSSSHGQSKNGSNQQYPSSSANPAGVESTTATNKHIASLEVKRGASALVYPTPPDPQSASTKANDDETTENSWATPGGNMGNWAELDDGLFGEEEEVTEADFNFFDQPEENDEINDSTGMQVDGTDDVISQDVKNSIQGHSLLNENLSTAMHGNTAGEAIDTNMSNNMPAEQQQLGQDQLRTNSKVGSLIRSMREHILADGEVVSDENPLKKQKGLFAPINFDTTIREAMDDKYDVGGRFFVPNPEESSEPVSEDNDEDDSDDSESSYSECSPANSKPASTARVSASPFSTLVPNVIDKSMGPDHGLDFTPGAAETSPVAVSKIQSENAAKFNEYIPSVTVDWVNLMTTSNSNACGALERPETREINFPQFLEKTLPILVDQIVWDDGLLQHIVPVKQSYTLPSEKIVKVIGEIFPTMTQTSLKDFVDMSISLSSGNNRTATSTSTVPGTPTSASVAVKLEKHNSTSSLPSLTSTTNGDTKSSDDTFNDQKPSLDNVPSLARVRSITASNEDPVSPDHELAAQQISSGSMQLQQSNNAARTALTDLSRTAGDDFISLPTPLFAFNRMGQLLKAQSPILRFWKIFGLQPLSGPKNVDLVCVFPEGAGTSLILNPFFDLLKSVYEDSALGQFSILSQDACPDGIIPIDLNTVSNMNDLEDRLQSAASTVGAVLAKAAEDQATANNRTHIMLMFVIPLATIDAFKLTGRVLADIKAKFSSLLSIGFKVVPQEFFMKNNTLVLPSQSKVQRLALQIYDLFSYEVETTDKYHSVRKQFLRNSPAFTLARKPPLKINFRLAETPSYSLLEEDTIIHISYAISDDNRWVIASWCDQWGEHFSVEAFSLGRSSNRVQKLEDITSQIWSKMLTLASCKPIRWKVIVTKSGFMSDYEQKVWLQVFEASVSTQISNCFLLQMDVNFSLMLTKGDNVFPSYNPKHMPPLTGDSSKETLRSLSNIVTTPGTPQKGTEFDTPDMYAGNTPTTQSVTSQQGVQPGNDTSEAGEISIIEVSDDTYGLVFRSRTPLPSFTSPDKLKPVIGGILLRPGEEVTDRIQGAAGVRPHQCLEFTILHSTSPPLMAVKNLLFYYRQLSSLAQYTGVSRHTMLPIHVEAVHKVARVFNYLDAV